jgi:hypothetical protein
MRERSDVGHFVGDDSDLYIEFSDVLSEPFGSIQIRAEQSDDRVVCRAEWGGWEWRAEGPDRMTAQSRLGDRLSRLDPFDRIDEGWGHPGHQVAELDDAIPPSTRGRMRDHTQLEARSAVGLLEAVFEAQARRPWAYPAEHGAVSDGVEIEGFAAHDGSLALFPRTFYEIANAYFGRAPTPQPGAGAASSAIYGEHPGLVGALRRLNEKGYMRSGHAKLPHQVQAIEVYLFRADPGEAAFL